MEARDELPKRYLSFPKAPARQGRSRKILHALEGVVLVPVYLLLAFIAQSPGLGMRLKAVPLGLRLFVKTRDPRRAFRLMFFPMDSFRYFEFHFIWKAIKGMSIRSYLDVSSPRFFPLSVVDYFPNLVADLVNPANDDLPQTEALAAGLGLAKRCRFHSQMIESAPFADDSFDCITSISVIEHIPNDRDAVRSMWRMLRPGGRLLITVPCAAQASEEYMNLDEYGLFAKDESGFVYWQRYYDETLIRQRIFCVTGEPSRMAVYGERRPGIYDRNVEKKRSGVPYPFWREPFMMGVDFKYAPAISALPGMGVVAMEFIKR
jgi:SAM-dependent methyltransferase